MRIRDSRVRADATYVCASVQELLGTRNGYGEAMTLEGYEFANRANLGAVLPDTAIWPVKQQQETVAATTALRGKSHSSGDLVCCVRESAQLKPVVSERLGRQEQNVQPLRS